MEAPVEGDWGPEWVVLPTWKDEIML
jgi:hypothetical protein